MTARSGRSLVAGIDVGGTKVLAVVIDPAEPATVLAVSEVPTPVGQGADRLFDAIEDVSRQVASAVEIAPTGVGLGLPGLVDRDGVLRYGPHLPGLINVDLGGRLSRQLQVPVSVDNDGHCAAQAEAFCGGGQGHGAVLFVGLGTGISCGMVINGELFRGGHGFAGEPGHFVIDSAGPRCACGRVGCWETLASGSGLAYLANQAVPSAASGSNGPLTGEDVTAAWLAGQVWAGSVVETFSGWVARGLAVLVSVVDPSVIVLGGTMAELGEPLLVPIRRRLATEVFRPSERGGPLLVAAELGRRAGAIGAALGITARGTRPEPIMPGATRGHG